MAQRDLPIYIWLPIVLFAAGSALLAVTNKTALQDWMYFTGYTPTEEILQISEEGQFSEEGERLFQRANPQFIALSEVGVYCLGSDNIGCVVDGPQIYIVDLVGENETEEDLTLVTAAHEMLHIAYSRLGDSDRESIDLLVAAELEKTQNSALRRLIEGYNDPEIAADEAHSQVGTEVDFISTDLVRHYGRYFDDRSVIVEAHDGSRSLLGNLR